MTFSISYMQLKKDRKGRQKEVLEVAKQRDINIFIVIKSYENHHTIIDECGEILRYRYRIKNDLLRMLKEMAKDLPLMRVNIDN
jgi:hypothetical protein